MLITREPKGMLVTLILGTVLLTENSAEDDYATLHHNSYQTMQRIRLDVSARRLHVQGSELWLTAMTALNVYTDSLMLVRSVPLQGMGRVEGLVALETGQLVVGSYTGLHVLDRNGSYVQTLHTEGVLDVVIHMNQIFALTFDVPSRVLIYDQNEAGEWVMVSNIKLKYRGQHLGVYNDTLYVTGRNAHLCLYSMSGELLGEYGVYGLDVRGTRPGLLSLPYLCNIDPHGNVLVADYWNYRLQVFDHTGAWSVVSLDVDTQWPMDAVVVDGGNTLWTMEWNNMYNQYYIVKYVANGQSSG